MNSKEALAEAKFCFRERVRGMYGYIDRENDPIEGNPPQKEFIKQCQTYWTVVFSAFEAYSKGNTIVEKAKLKREESVNNAFQQYYAEESPNYDPKEFLRAAYRAYDEYATEVAAVFHEFKEVLRKQYPIVL